MRQRIPVILFLLLALVSPRRALAVTGGVEFSTVTCVGVCSNAANAIDSSVTTYASVGPGSSSPWPTLQLAPPVPGPFTKYRVNLSYPDGVGLYFILRVWFSGGSYTDRTISAGSLSQSPAWYQFSVSDSNVTRLDLLHNGPGTGFRVHSVEAYASLPPGAPGGLTATAGIEEVALAWGVPTSGGTVSGYKVYRDGIQISITSGTSYTDTGLMPGTAYSYYVVAYNADGDSPASGTVTATPTAPPNPPGAPEGLTASAGIEEVALAWGAPTSGGSVSGYKLYRDGIQISTTSGTSYMDTGLTPGTTYSYYVIAYNVDGESPASNTTTATPLAPPIPPSAPTNLTAKGYDNQVMLTWNAPSTGGPVNGYRVYRDGGTLGTTINRSYSDTGAANGTTYRYSVRAYNEGGESTDSNTATATAVAGIAGPAAWTISLAGIGAAITNAVVSLSPLWLLSVALLVATGVLRWGADLIHTWRRTRS